LKKKKQGTSDLPRHNRGSLKMERRKRDEGARKLKDQSRLGFSGRGDRKRRSKGKRGESSSHHRLTKVKSAQEYATGGGGSWEHIYPRKGEILQGKKKGLGENGIAGYSQHPLQVLGEKIDKTGQGALGVKIVHAGDEGKGEENRKRGCPWIILGHERDELSVKGEGGGFFKLPVRGRGVLLIHPSRGENQEKKGGTKNGLLIEGQSRSPC